MDIVDASGVLTQPGIQHRLQPCDRQYAVPRADEELQLFAAAKADDRRALPVVQLPPDGGDQCLRVAAGDEAVDGLPALGGAAQVLELHERIARRVAGQVLARALFFQRLPAGPGRGQRVVAVAHGELQLAPGGVGVQTLAQPAGHDPLHEPAGDMPAALHQLEIIELREGGLLAREQADEQILRIVAQQQHVRQLQRRAGADLHPGRDAPGHGLLRGAHGRVCVDAVVVGLQVQHADHALPHAPVAERALHIDEGVFVFAKDAALQVFLHASVDRGDPLRAGALQRRLRQDQPQSRGSRADDALGLRPVFRLRGELVAGDHRPLFQQLLTRQEDVGRSETAHGAASLPSSMTSVSSPSTSRRASGASSTQVLSVRMRSSSAISVSPGTTVPGAVLLTTLCR